MSFEPILSYWFGDWDDRAPLADDDPQIRRWWHGTPAVDAEIRARLEGPYRRARAGELDGWRETARGTLALVLLLDQVPRNLFRSGPEAFATDPPAQRLVLDALVRGLHRELRPIERSFLYMPLQHAEDLGLQERSVALFEALAEEVEGEGAARAPYYRGALDFAVKHRDIVERFGRFPHRNAELGRDTTPDEAAFLAAHGRGY